MKNKSLTTLGYLMEQLGIPTVLIAQTIHVDASLVSKWRTGSRTLSNRSTYFEDVIACILEQSQKTENRLLKAALLNLYPQETLEDDLQIETLLRQALSNTAALDTAPQHQTFFPNVQAVSVPVFDGNAGRRDALSCLLDYAQSMTVPGEFTFFDAENFTWLIEDDDYCSHFVERLMDLVHTGFTVRIIFFETADPGHFSHLFNDCAPLIFHRNVQWFCNYYYDDQHIRTSFYLLNRALSLLGVSAPQANSTTMLLADHRQVQAHENYVNQVMENCSSLFSDATLWDFSNLLLPSMHFYHPGPLYSFLPSPVFMFAKTALLEEILRDNHISEGKIRENLELNRKFKKLIYDVDGAEHPEPFIYIFQMENMVRRATTEPFISRTLSIMVGHSVRVTKKQYAQMLRNLADDYIRYPHIHLYLASEADDLSLPSMNCWCRSNNWMIQMDRTGLRLCNDMRMVDAASYTLKQCIRKLPPERRERKYVLAFFLHFIEELESAQP